MKISIIVPVYNREDLIGKTLDSIKGQTFRPLQLILVDNGSTDESLSKLNQFRAESDVEQDMEIIILEEQKKGAAAARNRGAMAADGDWLIFFDSDDVMDASLVAEYASKITADIDIVNVPVEIETGGKPWRPYYPKKRFLENHILHSTFSTQRYMMRSELFEKAGGWNENLPGWNDWELGVRILLQSPRIAQIKGRPLVRVLDHPDSITGTDFSSRHEWWERAVDAAEADIRSSDHPQKGRLLKFIEFRRILLAGNYHREGNRELAQQLYATTCAKVQTDKMMRRLYPIVYKYICMGGRGAGRLIKKIMK